MATPAQLDGGRRSHTAAAGAVGTSVIVGAVAVVAAAVSLRSVPVGYDTAWILAWGFELADGSLPSYDIAGAPTPHPFNAGVAGLLWLPGDPDLAIAGQKLLTAVAFGVAVGSTCVIGWRTSGRATGIGAAVVVAVNVTLLREVGLAGQDVFFVALTTLAAALVVERRHLHPALVALACAGLIRPEGWVLAALALLWVRRSVRSIRPSDVALLVIAPLLWLVGDVVVTGDPWHSFSITGENGRDIDRPTGLRRVPAAAWSTVLETIRPVGLVAATIGIERLWNRAHELRWFVLGPIVAAASTFALIGATGLPLVSRYALYATPFLAVAASHAALGWRTVPRPATWWRRAGTLIVVLALAASPLRLDAARTALDEQFREAARGRELLSDALGHPAVRACEEFLVPSTARARVAVETARPVTEIDASPVNVSITEGEAGTEVVAPEDGRVVVQVIDGSPTRCVVTLDDG